MLWRVNVFLEGLGLTPEVWLSPLSARSTASGSSTVGVQMGAHLCPAGCMIQAFQHSRWHHGCACGLSHQLVIGAVVREGPFPHWRTVGEDGPAMKPLCKCGRKREEAL